MVAPTLTSAQQAVTTLTLKAQGRIHKAPTSRRRSRISQQTRRSLRLQGFDPIETTPNSIRQRHQAEDNQAADEVSLASPPPEPFPKQIHTSAASASKPFGWKTIIEARVDYWNTNRTWPTEGQERAIDRRRQELIMPALARKRTNSPHRKRQDASIDMGTDSMQSLSDYQQREQKSTLYKHPQYEGQLKQGGSFMNNHKDGITTESKELCEKLLKTPREPPKDTLFPDDTVFDEMCTRLRGQNKAKVIHHFTQLIVPSAEALAAHGAKHLEILCETVNVGWLNAIPFYGPCPQPDYSLGFNKEAFTEEQLRKLQPFIGNELEDCSSIAATSNMYLPFLTCEVKCGATGLDVVDCQNFHS